MQNYNITFSLRHASNSTRFWNLIILSIMIYFCCQSFDSLVLTLAFYSLLSIVKIFKDLDNQPKNGENFWTLFTPIVWAFALLYSIYWIINYIITKFNSWLDEKKF